VSEISNAESLAGVSRPTVDRCTNELNDEWSTCDRWWWLLQRALRVC